jgi:hypothetical protein
MRISWNMRFPLWLSMRQIIESIDRFFVVRLENNVDLDDLVGTLNCHGIFPNITLPGCSVVMDYCFSTESGNAKESAPLVM